MKDKNIQTIKYMMDELKTHIEILKQDLKSAKKHLNVLSKLVAESEKDNADGKWQKISIFRITCRFSNHV